MVFSGDIIALLRPGATGKLESEGYSRHLCSVLSEDTSSQQRQMFQL